MNEYLHETPPLGLASTHEQAGEIPAQQLFFDADRQVVIRGRGPTGTPEELIAISKKFDDVLATYHEITGIPVIDHRYVIASSYSQEYEQDMPTLCVLTLNISEVTTFHDVIDARTDRKSAAMFDTVLQGCIAYIAYAIVRGGEVELDLARPDQCLIDNANDTVVMVDVGPVPNSPEDLRVREGGVMTIMPADLADPMSDSYADIVSALDVFNEYILDFYNAFPSIANDGCIERYRELQELLESDPRLAHLSLQVSLPY